MEARVAAPASIGPAQARFGLWLLTGINLLNYLDRYLVAGMMLRIEEQFHVSHAQAGLLGSVFILVYMLASPLGGYLGDRIPRRYVVAGSVFLWSLATAGSAFAPTFGWLLVARAVTGIGEAGYAVVSPTLIADLFPRAQRTSRLAIFYAAMPLGAAIGFSLGGWLGEAYSWRHAFLVGGVPGLLLSLGMLRFKEPSRGATEEAPTGARISIADGLRQLRGNRIFWTSTVGLLLMTFSVGGLANWMPTFLERERGMTGGQAGLAAGAITAVAGIVGTLLGGFIGERADRRRPLGGLWVSGVGMAVAAPLMVLSAKSTYLPLVLGALFLSQVFVFFNSGPINAALCNWVTPVFRSFAMGLNTLIIHLFGDVPSPPLIGLVGDAHTFELAIVLCAIPIALGGLLLLAAPRLVRSGQTLPSVV